MPHTHSAAKHIRSDAKRRNYNQAILSELKTISKKLRALAASDYTKAVEYARHVIKSYDKAASNGLIPGKRADRKKGRVNSLLRKFAPKK